jgi:hypothetical protein
MSWVPPVPEDYNVMPPPRNASPPHVATVYNKCTGGGGAGVSPSEHPAYLALDLCSLVFCLLSFLHLPPPSVRFLGQARVGHERSTVGVPDCELILFYHIPHPEAGSLRKVRRCFC